MALLRLLPACLLLAGLLACGGTRDPFQASTDAEAAVAGPREPDPGVPPSGLKVYRTGAKAWVLRTPKGGVMLQGGGRDLDSAHRWMIDHAAGGDAVVLRTDDANGYNDYLYRQLGGLNSVTTLVVDTTAKANSAYVVQALRNAEAVFIAGGNQSTYDRAWRGTRLQEVLQELHTTKKAVLGGTSAGMAILGGRCYLPTGTAVISSEALADPYHPNLEALKPGPFSLAFLSQVLLETHFYERDRMGRLVAFLARGVQDDRLPPAQARAIACDEGTALCVESTGQAVVMGAGCCYLVSGNAGAPEQCIAGRSLDWYRGQEALKAWRLRDGQRVDLTTWRPVEATTYFLWVDRGRLSDRPY